jgi:hypothetical protein
MQIKFIGVPGEDHNSLRMYGKDYPIGEYVETTDPLAIQKMSNHPHFKAKASAAEDVQDAEVKGEFAAVIDAGLKMAEQEQAHGDANGSGTESPEKVGKPRGRRSSKCA